MGKYILFNIKESVEQINLKNIFENYNYPLLEINPYSYPGFAIKYAIGMKIPVIIQLDDNDRKIDQFNLNEKDVKKIIGKLKQLH